MNTALRELSIEQRMQLVEDLWDSIAADQRTLTLTDWQRTELDRRLGAFEADGNKGRTAELVLADIKARL